MASAGPMLPRSRHALSRAAGLEGRRPYSRSLPTRRKGQPCPPAAPAPHPPTARAAWWRRLPPVPEPRGCSCPMHRLRDRRPTPCSANPCHWAALPSGGEHQASAGGIPGRSAMGGSTATHVGEVCPAKCTRSAIQGVCPPQRVIDWRFTWLYMLLRVEHASNQCWAWPSLPPCTRCDRAGSMDAHCRCQGRSCTRCCRAEMCICALICHLTRPPGPGPWRRARSWRCRRSRCTPVCVVVCGWGAGEQGESLKECCGMRDGASNRTRAPKHAAAYEKQSMAS